jgi:hypothetical protein
LALLCGGCAARQPIPQTYRLVPGPLLLPPGVGAKGPEVRKFTAEVAVGMGKCKVAPGAIGIKKNGTMLSVTVRRDALAKEKPGWLSDWTAGLESTGCLAAGEGRKLSDQVLDSVALDPATAFRLRYPTDVEIGPQVRIQVVSPIMADGTVNMTVSAAKTSAAANGLTVEMKAPENLTGFETALYAVAPKIGSPGYRIEPLSAERHIKGAVEQRAQPAKDYFPFMADAGYYRLFYKEQQTAFTALVVAGASRKELEERVQALTGNANCDAVPAGYCVTIPKAVAVNLFLPVTVNGKEVLVRWGAKVGEAIREAGEKRAESVEATLKVTKMYRGRPVPVEFDKSGKGILDLTLMGGESIAW